MSEMNDSFKLILTEMCKRVGVEYADIDFKAKDWYWQYEWTESEQDSFCDWLVDLLHKNTKVRKEVMQYSTLKSKKICRKAAEGIILYLWLEIKGG